jgi:hypothetical protein
LVSLRRALKMKCKQDGCKGEIGKANISLRVGCGGCGYKNSDYAHFCNVCGRLYWIDGSPIFNKRGLGAFLKNGVIIHKEKDLLKRTHVNL